MIRDLAKALITVLVILILVAEVQRGDDAALEQFNRHPASAAR